MDVREAPLLDRFAVTMVPHVPGAPLFFTLLLAACAPPATAGRDDRVDVAIVPGCPSEADGRLSACQWARVVWAQALYAAGAVDTLVVSGSAVHNRYVEADALAAGLIALGVPEERILREPDAMHTDQNIALSLHLLEAHPDWRVSVATNPLQAAGCCAMVEAWSDRACVAHSLDPATVRTRIQAGLPDVRTEALPEDRWLPLEEREARIAAMTGFRRGSSWTIYAGKGLSNLVGRSGAPPLPPSLEETLAYPAVK